MSDSQDEELEKAVAWLREADGLLITAGAGIGVDSGLPDFRGREGFWRAYPALRRQGLSFEEMANPVILMFGDWGWVGLPYEKQQQRLTASISSVSKLVVVEAGAGRALPTVRRFSERFSGHSSFESTFGSRTRNRRMESV